jgi:hypothetical protein
VRTGYPVGDEVTFNLSEAQPTIHRPSAQTCDDTLVPGDSTFVHAEVYRMGISLAPERLQYTKDADTSA